MRFAAPRSDSPIKRPTRRRSTYGVPSDSEDEEFSSEETVASSSTDSFVYESESEIPEPPPRTKRLGRSVSQQHNMEDMISSIRLRVTHRDAYEEWEQQTRKDAFVSARDEQAVVNSIRRQSLATSQTLNSSTRSSQRQKQIDEVQNMLARFKIAKDQEETKFKQAWKERDRQIWEKIEHVIKAEEEKVKAKLEAERRKREEEERKKKEAEERARQEEERRRQVAEKKRQEEEEQRKQLAQEEEEKIRLQELEKQRAEQEQAEAEERKALGMTTALEDWKRGRDYLNRLKTGPMRMVKGRKETKSVWSAARRQITPKIGQITNDAQAIARIVSLDQVTSYSQNV
ncbi:hypothetical protein NM688_g8606 [Phlebia brevispora]|uniref:Uncharacterized protein n=1 Tax=Phlebia brevispora TaxID=194682 RepID=A0ACC1RRL6_9APHY|nr:hypothetical protein NM688_g8606 [Phlebia brevispora]